MPTREELLARTMVELADNLVANFDVVDVLHLLIDRCVEVLDVTASGLMVATTTPKGELQEVASSSNPVREIELLQIRAEEGACQDCYHSGQTVASEDLASEDRWPIVTPATLEAGFRSVHAVPLRLRGMTIGGLNLFRTEPGPLNEADATAARALADIATITILQHQAAVEEHVLNQQLQHALDSRVIIEQAKGKLAERTRLEMDRAFEWMRRHARNHNLLLADVAQGVIHDTIELDPAYIDH